MKVTAAMFDGKETAIDVLRKAERKKYAPVGRTTSTKKEKDESIGILKQYIGEVKLLSSQSSQDEDIIEVKDKKKKKKKGNKKSKKDKKKKKD